MKKHEAIYAVVPTAAVIRGDEAFDVAGNPVAYDEAAVQADMLEAATEFLRAAREALLQFVSSAEGEAPATAEGWPAEAGCLVELAQLVLRDLRDQDQELDLPFGAFSPRLGEAP